MGVTASLSGPQRAAPFRVRDHSIERCLPRHASQFDEFTVPGCVEGCITGHVFEERSEQEAGGLFQHPVRMI